MYRNIKPLTQGLSAVLTLTVAIVWLAGCAETKQPWRSAPMGKEVGGSGFLGGLYPSMREGKEGEGFLVYHNPKIEDKVFVQQYTKILLDPVRLYAGPDSKLPEVPQEQRETIAKAFYAQIYDHVSKDYEMVTRPGPNTLHIQVAIVDAEESSGTLEGISYIPMPVGIPGLKMALMQLKDKSTGKPPFAGDVTIEAKFTDAQTGEVLGASIDRRVGARRPLVGLFEKGTYDTWHDVDEAMRFWAEKLQSRLCQRRDGTNCVAARE